jgi:putative FmdB family regulatory protein
MATYCYVCECGHKFDAIVSIKNADLPMECPICKKPAKRVMSSRVTIVMNFPEDQANKHSGVRLKE